MWAQVKEEVGQGERGAWLTEWKTRLKRKAIVAEFLDPSMLSYAVDGHYECSNANQGDGELLDGDMLQQSLD